MINKTDLSIEIVYASQIQIYIFIIYEIPPVQSRRYDWRGKSYIILIKYGIPPVQYRRYNWRGKAAVQMARKVYFKTSFFSSLEPKKPQSRMARKVYFKTSFFSSYNLNLKMKMSQINGHSKLENNLTKFECWQNETLTCGKKVDSCHENSTKNYGKLI